MIFVFNYNINSSDNYDIAKWGLTRKETAQCNRAIQKVAINYFGNIQMLLRPLSTDDCVSAHSQYGRRKIQHTYVKGRWQSASCALVLPMWTCSYACDIRHTCGTKWMGLRSFNYVIKPLTECIRFSAADQWLLSVMRGRFVRVGPYCDAYAFFFWIYSRSTMNL